MKDYLVLFYKKSEKHGEKDTLLGRVEVSDHGVSENFTITGKAFRHADEKCFRADLVKVQPIQRNN